jgi:hypothetical protein
MDDTEHRALTYGAAVDAGMDPRTYAWEKIPEGSWVGRLDFKTWSNSSTVGHLICYFTMLPDEKRYRLSAFRPRDGSSYRYTAKDGGIDFSQQGLTSETFLLTVRRTHNGGSTWLAAEYDLVS